MKITLQQVQANIANIANRHEYTPDILYELLAAYGRSKSAITQLREGLNNKAEESNAVLQKDVVYFKTVSAGSLLEEEVEKLSEDPLTERYNPRYLIATDLRNLAAKDTRKDTTLSIKLADIDNEIDFFYGWTGDEVVDTKTEAVADRRAADKMNEIYKEIEKENHQLFISNPNFRHELNIFFTRLLFCFFAEDTDIFSPGQFSGAIKAFTQTDGSDLDWFFGELFKSLDTEDKSAIKAPFNAFPFVNGSIFDTGKHGITIPKFNAQARHLILESGTQNWGEINPDIFGVMFQGNIDPKIREENGMDYTSVPNILKVIEPLFLNGLREQFDKFYDDEKKLWALLNRISNTKIFDPACGSGNFLIISYKELRRLQHAIISRIAELKGGILGNIPSENLLKVDHLYGIEIDDFARELAVLSIHLAKHQMNQEFNAQFGSSLTIIPLDDAPTIRLGNAARIDWHSVCPNTGHTVTAADQAVMFELEGDESELPLGTTIYDEIYLIGNPPYKGSRGQSPEQKNHMKTVFGKIFDKYKLLDYIFIWFYKGSLYIKGTRAELAFLSTNSATQGEQVSIAWPTILSKTHIGFAYSSFLWRNSARGQAGVYCVIICLRDKANNKSRYIFTKDTRIGASHINAYLVDSDDVYIDEMSRPLSFRIRMQRGAELGDNRGNLTVSEDEKNEIIARSPKLNGCFREIINADSVINGRKKRYGIWLKGVDPDSITDREILERIKRVGEKRKDKPWLFSRMVEPKQDYLFVPQLSTERREYIPIAFFEKDILPLGPHFFVENAGLLEFSILSSRIHMSWMRSVSGKFKTDYRYSSGLVYNTFPVHPITETEKDVLNKSARKILLARAAHPGKTLADMYDPDKMPSGLREAHDENDHLVDSLYKKGGFANDEERLAVLFDLYEKMSKKD